MENHKHSLHFAFGANLVRCILPECDHSVKATESLVINLPVNSGVVARKIDVDSPYSVYEVTFGGVLMCNIVDYASGVLYLDSFNGNETQFNQFQQAVMLSFGIHSIQTGEAVIILSAVAP